MTWIKENLGTGKTISAFSWKRTMLLYNLYLATLALSQNVFELYIIHIIVYEIRTIVNLTLSKVWSLSAS